MDDLGWLKLQMEWGADEALAALPRDRLIRKAPSAAPHITLPTSPPAPLAAPAVAVAVGGIARAQALAAEATTLEDLRAALQGFSDCPLQPTAIHLVFAEGPAQTGLMLIGDTPGEAEDRSGRPFSGPGGLLLDRMLASIGLDRTRLRLTTAIPWRPPGNRKPTDHERALCLPFLHRHIALVRPRRLLMLGTAASAAVLAGSPGSVKRLRGRWQQASIAGMDAPVAALPSCNPDLLLTAPAGKREAWADLLTLRRALDEDAAEGLEITHS